MEVNDSDSASAGLTPLRRQATESSASELLEPRRADLDAAKGILICTIVLGHNYYFSQYFAAGFALLYNFHVASFLLLPFLFRYNRMNGAAYRERMFRTLVPQAALLMLTIPLFFLLFVADQPQGVGAWIARVPVTLLLQTETQLEAVSGFRHFWFLPAMAVLISLLWIVDNAKIWVVGVIVVFLVLWHLTAGEVDKNYFQYFPWGIAIVGFLFVPGLIVRKVNLWLETRIGRIPAGVDLMLFSLWFVLAWLVQRYRLYMPLAGDLYSLVSGVRQPVRLLSQEFFLLISFFSVLRLGWWARSSLLAPIGRESLKIFLLSPLVWQLFWMIGGKFLDVETRLEISALVALSFAFTLAVSYGLARLIGNSPIQSLVFPKSVSEWKGAWRRN